MARCEEAIATIRALWNSGGELVSRESVYFPLHNAVFDLPAYRGTWPVYGPPLRDPGCAEWRDHGVRYLVVNNVSMLRPALGKALASSGPFFKILRGLKKL